MSARRGKRTASTGFGAGRGRRGGITVPGAPTSSSNYGLEASVEDPPRKIRGVAEGSSDSKGAQVCEGGRDGERASSPAFLPAVRKLLQEDEGSGSELSAPESSLASWEVDIGFRESEFSDCSNAPPPGKEGKEGKKGESFPLDKMEPWEVLREVFRALDGEGDFPDLMEGDRGNHISKEMKDRIGKWEAKDLLECLKGSSRALWEVYRGDPEGYLVRKEVLRDLKLCRAVEKVCLRSLSRLFEESEEKVRASRLDVEVLATLLQEVTGRLDSTTKKAGDRVDKGTQVEGGVIRVYERSVSPPPHGIEMGTQTGCPGSGGLALDSGALRMDLSDGEASGASSTPRKSPREGEEPPGSPVLGRRKRKRRKRRKEKVAPGAAPVGTPVPSGGAPPGRQERKGGGQPPRIGVRVPRTSAVVITLREGVTSASYAEVMKRVRGGVSLRETVGEGLARIRRAATGGLILEVPGGGSRADGLAEKIREVVGGMARVARPEKLVELRVSGLDDSVSGKEVADALAGAGGCAPEKVRVGVVRRNRTGMGSAWCRLPAEAARRASSAGMLVIGWAPARVEVLAPRPLQCFGCLEPGHTIARCPGLGTPQGRESGDAAVVPPFRGCYNCGVLGHIARNCSGGPHCAPCERRGRPAAHRMGGASCLTLGRGGGQSAPGRGMGAVPPDLTGGAAKPAVGRK